MEYLLLGSSNHAIDAACWSHCGSVCGGYCTNYCVAHCGDFCGARCDSFCFTDWCFPQMMPWQGIA